jgi:hypothetical protein
MEDTSSRIEAAREVRGKPLEELVVWAVARAYPDVLRESIVTLELGRRAAAATIETAQYTRETARSMWWSVIAIALSSVVAAAVAVAPLALHHWWGW